MSQQEATNERKLSYSKWHRAPNLPPGCYAMNIDFLEIRGDSPKGFFEIAETYIKLEDIKPKFVMKFKFFHLKTLRWLSAMTNIPSFIVYHDRELKRFKIFETKELKYKILDEDKYKDWLVRADFE